MVLLRAEHDPDRPLPAGLRRLYEPELRALADLLACERQKVARPQCAAVQPAEAAPSIGRSAPEAALDREAAFDCQIAARGIAEPAHAEYLIAPEHDAAPAAETHRTIAHQLDFGVAAGDADAH